MTTSLLPEVKPRRLVMVTADNNNKYYNMTPEGTQWLAEWGRIGGHKSSKRYPMSQWKSKYNEKVRGGYKDVTDLVKTTTTRSEYAPISEPKIDALFTTLLGFSKQSVTDNYTVSSDNVTQAQVNEAQNFLNELTARAKRGFDLSRVNPILVDLYTVIPRRMKNVRDHLIVASSPTKELEQLRSIIDSEQNTLDVMAGQVSLKDADVSDDAPEHTILEALGISVELADASDEAIVRRLMGSDAHEFRAVYRVVHHESRGRFNTQVKNAKDKKQELFWHGSRNENWISILGAGLKIRPTNAVHTGSMFGDGIYFADKYRKSAGYTSLSGSYWARGGSNRAFLALLDVHVGKQYPVTRHTSECYRFSRPMLQQKGGYDSVFAKGGYDLINNEYVVYDNSQCSIKYLVEVGR